MPNNSSNCLDSNNSPEWLKLDSLISSGKKFEAMKFLEKKYNISIWTAKVIVDNASVLRIWKVLCPQCKYD